MVDKTQSHQDFGHYLEVLSSEMAMNSAILAGKMIFIAGAHVE